MWSCIASRPRSTWVISRRSSTPARGSPWTIFPLDRQVTHLINLARAFSLVAQDDDALHTLLTAEQKSPEIVRHSTVVREVVRSMYRRAPASAGTKSSPLLALAERCRAVR